jgi:hypothetical protein
MSTVRFDMPHALVTLTVTDEHGVEIEVWPKQGQSAFVVVPPEIARQIAEHINRLADEADGPDDTDEAQPSNVFDLMSRRAARDRGES